MVALQLFLSTFIIVFLLGLQSQFVRDSRIAIAFITSFGIGLCELMILKLAPKSNLLEMFAFLLGGPFGISVSIIFHDYLKREFFN